jgi:hypothetical protein
MPALVALKDTNFQTRDRMRRPSNQMRIAAALVTAKRFNKFVILHNKGMLFHTRPCPNVASVSAGHARHPSAPAPHSAVPTPAGFVTMLRPEDGEERADSTSFS